MKIIRPTAKFVPEALFMSLARSCVNIISDSVDYECYYFAYGPWGFTEWPDLDNIDYKSPLVIWVAEDCLISDNEFDWYNDDKPHGLRGIENICRKHSDKNFILLTEQLHLQSLVDVANLYIVELPPYGWREHVNYKVDIEKKSSQKTSWVTFLNNCTWHRVTTMSYLLAHNLDRHGSFSVSSKFTQRCRQFDHINNHVTYRFDQETYQKLDHGYQRLLSAQYTAMSLPPYPITGQTATNTDNFNRILLDIYKTTRLEIVCGTICGENAPSLSEKEIQSLFGCNFFIMISCAGTVAWLRDCGFDVFDDVVNHDYDQVLDPGQRILRALSDNHALLDGSVDLDKTWHRCRSRFELNISKIHSVVSDLSNKTLTQFRHVCNQVGVNLRNAGNDFHNLRIDQNAK